MTADDHRRTRRCGRRPELAMGDLPDRTRSRGPPSGGRRTGSGRPRPAHADRSCFALRCRGGPDRGQRWSEPVDARPAGFRPAPPSSCGVRYFRLANVAEQVHRCWSAPAGRTGIAAAAAGRPVGDHRAGRCSRASSAGADLVAGLHGAPTEASRPSVRTLRRIAEVLDGDRPESRLPGLIDLLWQTDELRTAAPTVLADEARVVSQLPDPAGGLDRSRARRRVRGPPGRARSSCRRGSGRLRSAAGSGATATAT
ncbi:hypothetical protein HBB16_15255 [Pseudonocardia sp. MCCB 268]|nr:hypothetical protein [Pseudonocardia cytotoxica]